MTRQAVADTAGCRIAARQLVAFRRKLLETSPSGLRVVIQYEDEKGELKEAGGLSYDAFNVRWADIKDRVVDEVSVAKAREDLELRRDAREGTN